MNETGQPVEKAQSAASAVPSPGIGSHKDAAPEEVGGKVGKVQSAAAAVPSLGIGSHKGEAPEGGDQRMEGWFENLQSASSLQWCRRR